MMRMVPITFTLLLWSLACSTEIVPEDGADESARQCLMQHKRHVSRSDSALSDVKSHAQIHAAPSGDSKVAQTISSTASKADKAADDKVASKDGTASKDDKDVIETAEVSEAAKASGSASQETKAGGQTGEDTKIIQKDTTASNEEKAVGQKSEDAKNAQTDALGKDGGKAVVQKGEDADSEQPADNASKGSSKDEHEENSNEDEDVETAQNASIAAGKSSADVEVSDSKVKSQESETKMLEDSNGRDLLPRHLMALAWKVFKTEEAIRNVVENAVVIPVTHNGTSMSLRINAGDDASQRLGSEAMFASYDLDGLGDGTSSDILNMIDIGGNYGVVTIAAMRKYAKKLRVITVEPIPVTFFFLKWNLYINGVPEIDQSKWDSDKGTPGVLALNSGSSDVAGQSLHFCAWLDSSMNSKMCDCKEGEPNCEIIPSITIDDLVGMFGKQSISMVKMDCEGCETRSLPALGQPDISKRVHRLAGELHMPEIPEDSRKNIEDIACKWDSGRLMSKCQWSPADKRSPPQDVECDVKLSCA